jgi:hypothetical protein
MDIVTARNDPGLEACLLWSRPLRYAGSVAADAGLPAFVRAASAIRRWNGRRVVVQDDVLALAVLDADDCVQPLLLPTHSDGARVFDAARGNKSSKFDAEAAAVLPDGRLLVFGSGASPAREIIFLLAPGAAPRLVPAAALYARLRTAANFAGAGLNLEGALVSSQKLLLLQRGNGVAAARNAIVALRLEALLAWLDDAGAVPDPQDVRQFDLGSVAGIAFGCTDACGLAAGRIALLACAENSASALTDGPVLGCRFAILDGDELRSTEVLDPRGRPVLLKLEGIEPAGGDEFDVVADGDDATIPALLGRLLVRGA